LVREQLRLHPGTKCDWPVVKMSRIKVYYILIGLAALFYRVSTGDKYLKVDEKRGEKKNGNIQKKKLKGRG
jgi:hypothetical protein